MRAMVVGGGVAGASCAIALRRIGMDVVLYEAYDDPAGQVGSFVSLAGNGLRALDALGVLRQVQATGFAVARQRMWSGGGRLLGDVPRGRRAGDPLLSVTVMRGDLVGALRRAAVDAGARVVTGERRAPDDPRDDGADLVLGADGIWSTTRFVLDESAPRPVEAGLYTVAGIAAQPRPEPSPAYEPGSFNMVFGRPGAFIYLPAPDGTVWWSAQVATSWPASTDPAELAEIFGAEPRAASIIRATGSELTFTTNHLLATVSRQHDHRTVLIGDAAHPVGAGQGASMAIEDAVVLARELHAAGDVPRALAAFVDLRRTRLAKLAETAGRNRDAKTAGPLAARLRDLVMPFTFTRFYEKATGWLYDYDPGQLPTRTRDRA